MFHHEESFSGSLHDGIEMSGCCFAPRAVVTAGEVAFLIYHTVSELQEPAEGSRSYVKCLADGRCMPCARPVQTEHVSHLGGLHQNHLGLFFFFFLTSTDVWRL